MNAPARTPAGAAAGTGKVRPSQLMRTLIRIFPLIWQANRTLLLLTLALRLVQAALPAMQIVATKWFFDAVALAVEQGGGQLQRVMSIVALQIGLALAGIIAHSVQQVWKEQLKRHFKMLIDGKIAAKSTKLPLSFFDNASTYDLLKRASNNYSLLHLLEAQLQLLQDVLSMAALLAVLAGFHWSLIGCLLLFMGTTVFANMRIGHSRYQLMRAQTPNVRRIGYSFGLMTDRETAKELRLFDLQTYFTERWRRIFWQDAALQAKLDRRAAWTQVAVKGLGAVMPFGIVMLFLWFGLSAGTITIGTVAALIQALTSAQQNVQMMAGGISTLYENTLTAADLFAFLQMEEESAPELPIPVPIPMRSGIRAEGLTFAYAGMEKPALRELNFTIRPGETIAIVGENGSGKSTLVKCLLGLYSPDSGRILYDNVDLKELSPAELRGHVSAVFQDFVRYQFTVRENIGFGRMERMEDVAAMELAAARGGADEVIADLRGGYDAELGALFEGGRELSYGQWQKLALSRAFFRDASVIALDEPTASMDPAAEVAVFERFLRLSEGRTSLIVSHRLGICRLADRIFVMKDGVLVEQGSHEELMLREGEYARAFRLQAQWYLNT
ncbi:ABC transporter ATP-binding protein [Paenibacillus koleovorans]|uniref:ABC transporter ATP-binding protein n=1 Tax=Paenibacillus koleovorans TaxID=121608 RepID=UPI000FD7DA10|nr:ABC transporter ATP-binding protein [Paenibacillus koleovorans]